MTDVILSNPRENALVSFMRYTKKMSINQIAEALDRSTRSVWATVKANEYTTGRKIDCRTAPPKVREKGMQRFRRKLGEIRMRIMLFLDHWVQTLEEAFNCKSIPLSLLQLYSKNSSDEDHEDEPP